MFRTYEIGRYTLPSSASESAFSAETAADIHYKYFQISSTVPRTRMCYVQVKLQLQA